MRSSRRIWLWRGVAAGVAGAIGLAVVLSLIEPPPTEQQRRAAVSADAALAESGLTPIGTPVVTGGSGFEDPLDALALAAGCVAFGLGVGAALGIAIDVATGSDRWRDSEGSLILAVTAVGYAVTVAGLAAVGRFRGRELLAFTVFWIVTGAAAWFSPGRSSAGRTPATPRPR